MTYLLITPGFLLAGSGILYFFRRPFDWIPVLVILYLIVLGSANYFIGNGKPVIPDIMTKGSGILLALLLIATAICILRSVWEFIRDLYVERFTKKPNLLSENSFDGMNSLDEKKL